MNTTNTNTLRNTYNSYNETPAIQHDDMKFTGTEDLDFPRTRQILMEQPQIDTKAIYSQRLWNIEYFFQRKRSELWLDDDTPKNKTNSKNKTKSNKLSPVDKLLLAQPSYMNPIKNLKQTS